jgi:hypothetical protein
MALEQEARHHVKILSNEALLDFFQCSNFDVAKLHQLTFQFNME